MKIYWTELVKFFKNNFKKMLFGALIGIIATISFALLNRNNTIEKLGNDESITLETDALPANFSFYIENNQEEPFINNLLIQELFISQELLDQASEVTNTNLNELVINTGNNVFVDYLPSGETNLLSVTRNGSTHIHEFSVNVGEEEKNLEISRFYFDYLMNDNVQFLEGKNIYVFSEPAIIELDDEQLENINLKLNVASINLVVVGVAGALFGIVVSIIVLLFLSLISKRLVYSFSYFVPENNYFMLLNNTTDEMQRLDLLLNTPTTGNKIVVIEETLNNEELLRSTENVDDLKVVPHALKIDTNETTDRVILIIKEGETSRKWYNTQRLLVENYGVPVFILQINK